MRIFYLFRSDLKILESYHKYKNLEDFKKNCWDFYLIMCLWLLENNYFDEIVVWRLLDKKKDDIIFKLPGKKKFIQKFVRSLDKVFNYPRSDLAFFRGGFKIYDDLTRKNPDFFGIKLYLGANGPRKYSIYGGKYDKILVEDERDLKKNCIPFYKIGIPGIFKPLDLEKKYDISWVCNFTQIRYKGQEYFIKQISRSKFLRSLKIIHVGNKPEIGKRLCQKYRITNVEFIGHISRFDLNEILNLSKFGVVTSNGADGSPRISTEILSSGTPLLIRKQTRLLRYYRKLDYVKTFDDDKFKHIYEEANKNYKELRQKNLDGLKHELNLDNIMAMNLKLWGR